MTVAKNNLSIFAFELVLVLYLVLGTKGASAVQTKRPHIVVIMADDLGYNDVSFHGSSQIPTPNIDALAYNGIMLNRFYTQCTCTPSRAAFLTGKYPLRFGMQGYPLKAGENRSLPTDLPTMPEQLKKLGYKTHLVGKWHLGSAYRKSTPTGSGFDTHFGYWNGFVGYFDYVSFGKLSNTMSRGYDLHDNLKPDWSSQGKYATELFTDKSLDIIDNHNNEEPLFLVIAHLAPHTGTNGTELETPIGTDAKFGYITDLQRRNYAGVVSLLDDSVGRIIRKLHDKHLLDNTIVLFFSDNGAQTIGMYANAGSNFPLRGLKFTDFEGGVRTAAALYSPLLTKRSYVSKNLIHLVDWLPTFYAAAGGNVSDLGDIDGINQWSTLSENGSTVRTEILVNINEVDNTRAIISHSGRFKLVEGWYHDGYDQYYGETGGNSSEIVAAVLNVVLHEVPITEAIIEDMRLQSRLTTSCWDQSRSTINCTDGCLFDLEIDACESTNIIDERREIAAELYKRLEYFQGLLVPQTNRVPDPLSNPAFYNGTWCTWLDDELCDKTQTM